MYGKDYEYARSRIENTILCLNNGNPVYIHQVSNTGKCAVSKLIIENSDMEEVNIDDINCKPPHLGYVNTRGTATYVSRVPMRRDWKQGLRRENMHSFPVDIRAVKYHDLANCIVNKYPSLAKAYEAIIKPGSTLVSIAFHRHWAIDRNLSVLYKGRDTVGKFNAKTFEIELNEKYNHLFEYLQESL